VRLCSRVVLVRDLRCYSACRCSQAMASSTGSEKPMRFDMTMKGVQTSEDGRLGCEGWVVWGAVEV